MGFASRFGGRVFVLAALANFAYSLGFHSYLHLPGLLEDLGADPVGVGTLMAITFVVAVLVRPWVGRTMDTRGRRWVALGGGVLHVLTAFAYLGVDRIGPLLIGLRVVHGIALGMVFSSMFTIAADVIPARHRAQGIGLFGVSGMLPLALGGVMGDLLLAQGQGYGRLFWAIGLTGFVGWALTLPIPETADRTQVRRVSFWRAAVAPELRSVWFMGLAFAFSLASFFIFVKTFTRETGVGSVGEALSWYAGVAIFLRVFVGGLPERLGLFVVLYPALLLSSAGLFTLSVAQEAWQVDLAAALCGGGHGFAFPIISALVVSRASDDARGSAVSLFTALFDLGVILGGPALGAVIKWGGYGLMFALAGTTCAAATVVFWRWESRRAGVAASATEYAR